MHISSSLVADTVNPHIKKVFHSAVRIKKSSPHCTIDVGSGEPHTLHVGHRCITLWSHCQS